MRFIYWAGAVGLVQFAIGMLIGMHIPSEAYPWVLWGGLALIVFGGVSIIHAARRGWL